DPMPLPCQGIGTHLDLHNLVLGAFAAFHVPRRIWVVTCPEATALPPSLGVVDPPLHRPRVIPQWIGNADGHKLTGFWNKRHHRVGIDSPRHRHIIPKSQNTLAVNED